MTCTQCKKEKDENDFPSNGDGRGGHRKQCKDCMREINKQWRASHKQIISEYNKKRRKGPATVAV